MFKYVLLLSSVVFFSFITANTVNIEEKNAKNEVTTEVKKEIETMQLIINSKLEKASILEQKAELLLEKNPDSKEAITLLKESELELLMTLKYRAAIACRMQ